MRTSWMIHKFEWENNKKNTKRRNSFSCDVILLFIRAFFFFMAEGLLLDWILSDDKVETKSFRTS